MCSSLQVPVDSSCHSKILPQWSVRGQDEYQPGRSKYSERVCRKVLEIVEHMWDLSVSSTHIDEPNDRDDRETPPIELDDQ